MNINIDNSDIQPSGSILHPWRMHSPAEPGNMQHNILIDCRHAEARRQAKAETAADHACIFAVRQHGEQTCGPRTRGSGDSPDP